jgi:hypothetical protein
MRAWGRSAKGRIRRGELEAALSHTRETAGSATKPATYMLDMSPVYMAKNAPLRFTYGCPPQNNVPRKHAS